MEVTPFIVNHSIDGVGYTVRDGSTVIVFSGDTGPTDDLWDIVNADMNVKAVFVETSFPNELQAIADASGHFTPQTLDADLRKLTKSTIPIYLYHLKPVPRAIVKEIDALKRTSLCCEMISFLSRCLGNTERTISGVGIDERTAWVRCPGCVLFFSREATRNLSVCSECRYHFRIGARRRVK
jgi:hypothetical protein